jgi:PAS domain S-box-containing protein
MNRLASRWLVRWRIFWRDNVVERLDSPDAPLIALAIGATVCAGGTLLALEAGRAETRAKSNETVVQVRRIVEARLHEYVSLTNIIRVMADPSAPNLLEGLRGSLTADTLRQHYPSASYLAFIRHVADADLASYELSMRNTLLADDSGSPAFRPKPLVKREGYFFLEKVVPATAVSSAPGADLSNDPIISRTTWADDRNRAPLLVMPEGMQAGALATPALVATVNNVLARPGTNPVMGILVLGIDFQSLVQSGAPYDMPPGWRIRLLSSDPNGNMALRAEFPVSGKMPATMSEPRPPAGAGRRFVSESEILLGGQALRLQVAGTFTADSGLANILPWTIFLIGVLITMVLYLLVRQVHKSRNSAESLAARRWQEIEQSQQRFRDLVESSSDWIWELDENMRIRYASPTTRKLLGIEAARLVGKPMSILSASRLPLFPFDPASPHAYTNFERTLAGPNGKACVFESAGAPVFDSTGRFAGMRGIDRDVTTRRQFGDSLAKLREELADNMQANLVSQLLSGIAHELNQPLSAIVSYNQACIRLLESGDATPGEIASAMRSTASNAMLAGDIVKRLRRISAKGTSQARPTLVKTLVKNVLGLAEHRMRSAEIDIKIFIAAELPAVMVDPVLVTQVLLNLMHNAADAMARSPNQQIRIDAVRTSDNLVRITVSDNGPGIAPDVASRIFEPHFTTKEHGMGIGLTISRSIIEALGGTLICDSTPGEGARFTIELPAEKALDSSTH